MFRWNNNIRDFSRTSRSLHQQLYEASKKGLVTCEACGAPLQLYLGIRQAPHLFHMKQTTCTAFASPTPHDDFIKPKKWKVKTPFLAPQPKATLLDDRFYQTLLREGITLNEAQWEAVTTTEGSLLLLAGAGSGKTRVLTARTAYMLTELQYAPRSFMLVTFTAKAANEMKQRLASYPGVTAAMMNEMVVGTFHSIFYRILQFHRPEQFQKDRLIKFDWQKEQWLKQFGRELGLDERDFPYDMALQLISYWKNTCQMPDDVNAEDKLQEQCVTLYRMYEQKREAEAMFDFEDMLLGCLTLFREEEAVLAQYRERFKYLCIDEFQDVNAVQFELIKLLNGSGNLCVVGDDDQSIYAFRGSDPTFILQFATHFPQTKTIHLADNYRSSHSIVSFSNATIAHNYKRHPKQMRAQFDNEKSPKLFFPFDEEEEATMIVTDITEKLNQGVAPRDIAILTRTHTAMRAIFERLVEANLPFQLESEADSFYNRRIVRSVLAFLRLALNEDDEEAMQDIIGALFLKQGALQDIKAHSVLQDCTLLQALKHIQVPHAFQRKKLEKIAFEIPRLRNEPPSLAIDVIERELGFDEFLKKRGGEGNLLEKGSDDVRDLKVVARKFTKTSDLLQHIATMKQKTKEVKKARNTVQDGVQLLTIHRAKGLEYRHVYLLAVVDGSIPHDYALEQARNGDFNGLEEERRLLYVAMTRAMESLQLSVLQERRGRKATRSRFISPAKKS